MSKGSAPWHMMRPELPDWYAAAACAEPGIDPELFFPERGQADVSAARAICQRCPVAAECLAYALSVPEWYGVWGGTTERERRRLRNLAT